jgi:hypothetical protein
MVIESIQEGDEVMTRDQDCPGESPKPGRVTRVFRNVAPAILWLSLANGQVVGTTLGHEVWTLQSGWKLAGQLAVGEDFIDQEGRPVRITGMVLEARPTAVYNLEVDGSFTYFADGVWVHNGSRCVLWPQQKWNKMVGEAYQDWINTLYGYVRNHEALPSGHVPDILDRAKGIIGDVKNVESLEKTSQLTAIANYARDNGLTPILVVSESNVKFISPEIEKLGFILKWGP